MELKSRQAYILRFVVESQGGRTLEEIIQKTCITQRTFYYDFAKINEWLNEKNLGQLVIRSKCVKIQSERIRDLKKIIKKNKDYFYSIEERRILTYLFVLLSPRIVTIEELQKIFDVSKNTILTDIRELKVMLNEQNLEIVNTIKTGYVIRGEESLIRRVAGQKIKRLDNFQPKDIVKEWMQDFLCEITGKEYDYFEIARCLIKQYEQDEKIKLVSENEEFNCNMLLISWIRSMEDYIMIPLAEERASLVLTKPYYSLKKSFRKLKEHNIGIPETEIYYMTMIILGIQVVQFSSKEEEDLYIYRFTASLIKNYENIACTTFKNRERLINQLSRHIRPLYYRIKYGMQLTDSSAQDARKMYPEVYEFTKRAIERAQDEWARVLTEDEIMYIAVYFISDEKRQPTPMGNDVAKILILCATGMATSTLIKEQMKELLGSIIEIDIGAVTESEKYVIEEYALVVSNSYTDFLSHYKNVIFTDVILHDYDKKKIIHILNKNGIVSEYAKTAGRIVKLIEDKVEGMKKNNELYFDILRLLYEERHQKRRGKKISFQEYMENGDYEYLPIKSNADMLMELGCRMLAGEKAVQQLYEKMKHMLRRHKLKYYEIMKDVVLIHCPMFGDINGDIKFAVIISEEIVSINSYIGGRIFIFFSTVDQNSHFPTLMQLYFYCDSVEGTALLQKLKGERE